MDSNCYINSNQYDVMLDSNAEVTHNNISYLEIQNQSVTTTTR